MFESKQRGMPEGIELGKQQGMEKGLELGKQQGMEKGLELGKQQGLELEKLDGIIIGKQQGIQALILDHLEEGFSQEKTLIKLQKRFQLTEEKAKQSYDKFAKNNQTKE